MVALPRAVLKSGYHPRAVVARNTLVTKVPWIHGVKTGHTTDAGYVLVGEGTRKGMTLLSAVLGTPSEAARDSSTLALLDWGFANFRLAKPVKAGSVVARRSYNGDSSARVDVIAAKTVTRVIPKTTRLAVRRRLRSNINGPLKRGAQVGTATVLAGAKTVASVPLVLARAIPGLSWSTKVARFITKPYTLIPLIIAVLALATTLTVFWRTRRRAAAPA